MTPSDGPVEQRPGSIDLLAFLDVHVNALFSSIEFLLHPVVKIGTAARSNEDARTFMLDKRKRNPLCFNCFVFLCAHSYFCWHHYT